MRGHRGTQQLAAHRIAQAASSEENMVSPLDVAPWLDLDHAVEKAAALEAKLPKSVRQASDEERRAYIAARRQREPGWSP